MDEDPQVMPQLIAASLACIGPLMFGFAMGYSSPAIPELQKSEENGGLGLNEEESSWFSSIIGIGALLSGPFTALLVDKFGRKLTIMLCCVPFSIGWFLMLFPNSMFLYIGRTLTGFGTGMTSLAVPTYISEISSKHLRGALGAGFQLSITIGVLIMFLGGLKLHYTWLAVFASCFSVLLIGFMFFLPESPSWLLKHHNYVEAKKSLKWLRGERYLYIENEINEIEENFELQGKSIKLGEIFQSISVYKPLLLILFLMFFQQFSGVNAVIFNSESIFEGAGFKNMGGVASVILASVQVTMTFVSCILMDRVGRKTLLLLSGTLMCISCVMFSLYYMFEEKHVADPHKWYMQALSLGSLMIYISMFSIGWGPIPWLFMSEILPAKARGTCSGAATATNWICAFFVTKCFTNLQQVIKPYGVFWLFGGVNFIGVLFVAVFLIETKGRSLEEIERCINGHSNEYSNIQPTSVNDNSSEQED